jgi:glycosyltransferase involved in cell wall biosynthesis
MRVLIWPANDDASAWYRLKYPAFELAAQGTDVTVASGVNAGPRVVWDQDWSHLSEPPLGAHVVGLDERPDADVVVINRPARAHWAETIPFLQAAGVKVVVDVDDDFDAIPVGNSARAAYDERRNPRSNRQWITRACQLADLVTVSTPDLAVRYAKHGRVRVLPNLVPAWYLDVEPVEPLQCSVGWSGSVDTHPDDLEATGGAVAQVLNESPGWGMHVVGSGKGVAQRLGVPHVTSTGGWVHFAQYPRELARFEVGIVPLSDSRFNRSKSALKLAELSAVGVPTVASASPDNRRLHKHGAGLLAVSRADWVDNLTELVNEPAYRADVAGRSREAMRSQTYEQWADLWACAWESTLTKTKVAA